MIKLNHSSEMDIELFSTVVKEAENILNQKTDHESMGLR